MEPKRGMLIQEITVSGITLKPSDYVWILDVPERGTIPVEFKNREIAVPESMVVQCPVPRPSLQDLRKSEDCFGRSADYFTEEYASDACWFRLLRCKKHGNLFLEDTRGGIAMYTRTILVAQSAEDPETIWRRYHALSDDWLNYAGIAY